MTWTEIFRAGSHTDSAGNTREWTPGEIEQIARDYDPSWSEAPEVVGHPETNSPAYGWVEKLKAEGGKLLATFKQRDPGFVEMLRAGRFKNRSVSLVPMADGGWYLRHVGWLGAVPPAVKGLQAAAFQEGDSIAFEFAVQGGDEQMDKDQNTDKAPSWFTAAFQPVLDFIKGEGKKPDKPATTEPPAVGSAAFAEALKAAVADQVTPLKAEFTTQIEALKTENADLQTKLDTAAQHGARTAVDTLIEQAAQEGRWIPAFNEDGTREMVYAMAEAAPVEFGEADKDGKRKKLSGIDQVKNYLAKLPRQVLFSEMTAAAGDNRSRAKVVQFNAPTDGKTGVMNYDLAARAEQIFADAKGEIDYGQALRQARREQKAG